MWVVSASFGRIHLAIKTTTTTTTNKQKGCYNPLNYRHIFWCLPHGFLLYKIFSKALYIRNHPSLCYYLFITPEFLFTHQDAIMEADKSREGSLMTKQSHILRWDRRNVYFVHRSLTFRAQKDDSSHHPNFISTKLQNQCIITSACTSTHGKCFHYVTVNQVAWSKVEPMTAIIKMSHGNQRLKKQVMPPVLDKRRLHQDTPSLNAPEG